MTSYKKASHERKLQRDVGSNCHVHYQPCSLPPPSYAYGAPYSYPYPLPSSCPSCPSRNLEIGVDDEDDDGTALPQCVCCGLNIPYDFESSPVLVTISLLIFLVPFIGLISALFGSLGLDLNLLGFLTLPLTLPQTLLNSLAVALGTIATDLTNLLTSLLGDI